jgi:predicted double-glycine peptidase
MLLSVQFGIAVAIVVVALCSALPKTESTQRAVEGPWPSLPASALPASALMVPMFRQATLYTCGVASLDAIMYYWQVYEGTEGALARECATTEEDGTKPASIVKVAEHHNLTAYMKEGLTLDDLESAVAEGWTLIVDVQAWALLPPPVDWANTWEDGHYVVLLGLDADYVFLMDPSTGAHYAYVPRQEFLSRWHDYETLPDGRRYEYNQMAIFIRGTTALPSPASVLYMG